MATVSPSPHEPIDPTIGTVITCSVSDGLGAWLAARRGTLAISAYQANKLVFVGWNGRQISLLMRQFSKPMGLAVQERQIALACRHELFLFANDPALAGEYLRPGQYDALYLPRACYFTGDLNTHDLAFGKAGLWLVNTRFSCLSLASDQYSFIPRWQPKFITQLTPEDRCHLNGLGLLNGEPAYVTALGTTDEAGAWRANKADGGVMIDVASGEIVLRGLSMPHSPRYYDGRWWLLNSGTGELWQVDPQRGEHTVVCALPSFVRGLCFVEHYAVIGMSRIREKHIFGNLPVQQRFEQLICGAAVVDLRSGQCVAQIEFTAGCTEVYDVQFLSGILRPTILNLEKERTRDAFSAPDVSFWLQGEPGA